ncbi:hypothetical protein HDV05_001076 [Chytridiales sp. JEL 0842]|nr:hypothetical protein HDV05_001076 [Chytridiales sp. JEL 0842]
MRSPNLAKALAITALLLSAFVTCSQAQFVPPPKDSPFNQYGKSFVTASKSKAQSLIDSGNATFTGVAEDFGNFWDDVGDAFKSIQPMFYKKGSVIWSQDKACEGLPVRWNDDYAYINPLGTVFDLITLAGIGTGPFMDNGNTIEGIIFDQARKVLAVGVCLVANENMLAIGLVPGFPGSPWPGVGEKLASGIQLKSSNSLTSSPVNFKVTGFGISWRTGSSLNYTHKALQPWTGYNGLNPPAASGIPGQFWFRYIISTLISPKCPKCELSMDMSIITGVNSETETALVIIENLYINISFLKLLNIGNGFGLWRNQKANLVSGGDSICEPSGIFLRAGIDAAFLPQITGPLGKYLGTTIFKAELGIDMYISFRPKDGFYATGLRLAGEIIFLGMNFGVVDLEFQYIQSNDIKRRRAYYGSSNPCKITCNSRDSNGLCTDQTAGVRKVDSYIMGHPDSNFVLFFFEYLIPQQSISLGSGKPNLKFRFTLFPVDLTNLVMIVAVDTDKPSNEYIKIGCQITVLWVLDIGAYVTIEDGKAEFGLIISTPFAVARIGGKSDVTGSIQQTPSDSPIPGVNKRSDVVPFINQSWDISVNFDWAPWMKDVAKWVTGAAKEVAKFCKDAWNAVSGFVKGIANEIAAFFSPGGALVRFANEVGDFLKDVGNAIADFGKAIGNLLVTIGKSVVNNLADAGKKLFSGDVKGAFNALGDLVGDIGDALQDFFGSTSRDVIDTGKLDQYGCRLLQVKTRKCDFCAGALGCAGCSTSFGTPYSDVDCLTALAKASATVTEKADKGKALDTTKVNSENARPGLVYLANNPTYEMPPPSTPASNSAGMGLKTFAPQLPVQFQKLSNTQQGSFDPASLTHQMPVVDLNRTTQAELNDIYQMSFESFRGNAKDTFLNGQDGLDGATFEAAYGMAMKKVPKFGVPPPITTSCTTTLPNFISFLLGDSIRQPTVDVDPACNGNGKQLSVLYNSRLPSEPNSCSSIFVFEWRFIDSCGQVAQPVFQNVVVNEQPPKFDSIPANLTISCESEITPAITGTPVVSGGCGVASLNVTFVDERIPGTRGCGSSAIIRRWRAEQSGCGLIAGFVQRIDIVDTTGPAFGNFPANAEVNLYEAVGTDVRGFPTAYDTCGNGPSRLWYNDTYTWSPRCGADKTIRRRWSALDSCGNLATRDQTIRIVNKGLGVGDAVGASLYTIQGSKVARSIVDGQMRGMAFEGEPWFTQYLSPSTVGLGNCSNTPYDINALFFVDNSGFATRLPTITGLNSSTDAEWGLNQTQTWERMRAMSARLSDLTTNIRTQWTQGPVSWNCSDGNWGGPPSGANNTGLITGSRQCNLTSSFSQSVQGTVSWKSTLPSRGINFTGTHPYYNFFKINDTRIYSAFFDRQLHEEWTWGEWVQWRKVNAEAPYNITFDVPAGSLVVIDVPDWFVDFGVYLSNTVFRNGATSDQILWNFNNVGIFSHEDNLDPWPGSILGPNTFFSLKNSVVQGSLVGYQADLYNSRLTCNIFYGFRECADPVFRIV